MIRLLYGDNDFELTRAIKQAKDNFDGRAERYDATDLTPERLADLFAGQTLFAMKRLVIIDSPSVNPMLWQQLPVWAERLSSDTTLLLIEPKPDKRTTTFKWLKKNADVQEYQLIDERNISHAVKWAADYAQTAGVTMTTSHIRRVVERAGTNQWAIAHAIDKLALLDAVTDDWIDDLIEARSDESVFSLFETALNKDARRLQEMIGTLRRTEDPYRLLGLISAQALQLAALSYGHGDVTRVAVDTGARSTYPLQKLVPYANRLNKSEVDGIIHTLAAADMRLKTSDADPWTVLESSLVRIASLEKS